jgi:transcription termination/antitermination protein NusG
MSHQESQNNRHWYAIHTYAGYEDAVARNLKQRIDSLNMGTTIFDVLVPVEKSIKIKGSKRVEVSEKVYPGYVLVDMIVDDDSWYVVRNTPRVTGFVGAGTRPVPLSQSEIDAIFARATNTSIVYRSDFQLDDKIQVLEGPFKDQYGTVSTLLPGTGRLQAIISMFGRETPVELDFLQIKKI